MGRDDRQSERAWRWRTPLGVGQWQPSLRAALLDAVEEGLGSVDEWPDSPVYLDPLVSIEERPIRPPA